MRQAVFACVSGALLLVAAAPAVVVGEASGVDAGRQLYDEKCGMCHKAGGMGTGLLSRRFPQGQELLEQRTNLHPDFIAVAVRSGIGNMPRISRAEVSDEQLALISRYLTQKKDEQ